MKTVKYSNCCILLICKWACSSSTKPCDIVGVSAEILCDCSRKGCEKLNSKLIQTLPCVRKNHHRRISKSNRPWLGETWETKWSETITILTTLSVSSSLLTHLYPHTHQFMSTAVANRTLCGICGITPMQYRCPRCHFC